jgi:15-cis-phytoene synthase
MDKLDYAACDTLLKRDDRDRWLASLFLSAALRPHIQALYAFSLEIARVRQLVSEPALGEMRFQYWREVLAGEGGGNPVAAALLDTMARFNLPRDPLIGLIDARLFDLYDAPMPTIAALENYAKATAANLFRLAASILDPQANVDTTAEHAGIAYAVTGLLRAFPWHAAAGQTYIPCDVLARHGLKPEDLRGGRDKLGVLAALAEMRGLARAHLREFAALPAARTGKAAQAFLPIALCEPYLRQMERPGYDFLASRIAVPEWRRLWLLWRTAQKIG